MVVFVNAVVGKRCQVLQTLTGLLTSAGLVFSTVVDHGNPVAGVLTHFSSFLFAVHTHFNSLIVKKLIVKKSKKVASPNC